MAISFCACGSTSDTEKNNTDSQAQTVTPEKPQTEQETAAPADISAMEYRYQPEFIDVSADEKVSYVYPSEYLADGSGFYATGEVITGSVAPEGAVPQYYGQFDKTEPAIFFVSSDGVVKILENYRQIDLPEAEEGMYEYNAMSIVSNISVIDDGNLLDLEEMYRNWSDVEDLSWDDEEFYEHYHYDSTNYIRVLDPTGKELSIGKIEHPSDEYYYCSGTTDNAGNLLYSKGNDAGEYSLAAYSFAGEPVYEVALENGDSLNTVFKTTDGTIYVTIWGMNGMQMRKFDPETKSFGEAFELPQNAYNIFTGGGDYPLYYTSGTYFYGYDPESGKEADKLLSWLDCDVNPDEMYDVYIDAEGVIHGMLNSFDSYSNTYDRQLIEIAKKPYDPSTAKKALTLSTQGNSWELVNAVNSFNRKNDKVRIEIKDYSEYNTEEDYSAGLTKLQTEIMSGTCPDIIDMRYMPLAQLASKNLLEDLYPYMESDTEISKENFLPNILAAAETSGKLLHTISWFNIDTVIGASSIVGEKSGWTYDEMYSALRNMPADCTPFDVSTTRSDILNICLGLEMGSFVNWETGEVNFNNEDFAKLLKFAGSFPAEYDWETYDYETDSPEVRIREGRQMLYATNISSVDGLMYIEASYNGMPVTFIGYPTGNGTGNTVVTDPGFAMSASCTDKEEAWNFLRQFFTEKYYDNYGYYGLPVVKNLLEKKLKTACTVTYEIDEYGQYKLDENGEKIPEKKYYGMNGVEYAYYCLSEEMAAKFMELVNSTNKIYSDDQSIKDIVVKQAEAFFSGQKSAEEVAKLVQSNAMIYVNEQR